MTRPQILRLIVLLFSILTSGRFTYSDVPTNGLIAYLPLNGTAEDASGQGNHGLLRGARPAVDRFGIPNSALEFNGGGDFIKATVKDLPLGASPRTISFWAKPNPDPTRGVGVVEYGTPANGRAFGIMNNGSPYTWVLKTYGGGAWPRHRDRG
jgi:hypothetical protein